MKIADILREHDEAVARAAGLARQLAESERVRADLSQQLLLVERRSRPPVAQGPCRHCGLDRLSLPHLVAGGGHSFEADPC